jgi:hypothetical protein
METKDGRDITQCYGCEYWKDPSPATGYRYGFCTKPHNITAGDFFCKDGMPKDKKEGGTQQQ